MNHWQAHVCSYALLQQPPEPRNAEDEHALGVFVILIWLVGFGLMLWMGRRR